MPSIISSHNLELLQKNPTLVIPPTLCNCRKNNSCPLYRECCSKFLEYKTSKHVNQIILRLMRNDLQNTLLRRFSYSGYRTSLCLLLLGRVSLPLILLLTCDVSSHKLPASSLLLLPFALLICILFYSAFCQLVTSHFLIYSFFSDYGIDYCLFI